MINEQIISGVVKLYNDLQEDYEIDLFLHEHNVPMEKFPEIKTEAKKRSEEERLRTMPAKMKRRFFIFVGLTVLTIYVFFVFLPYANVFSYQILFSIIGGLLTSGLALLTWSLYKSWQPKRILEGWKFRYTSLFFVVLILPTVILGGINWFIYGRAERNLLRDHHEEVIGVVVNGQSISTRRADFTNITVQFKTKEGKMMLVTESVPSSSFDNYYKGQKLKLIYYTGDPNVISILQSDSETRDLLGIPERSITPRDLVAFTSLPSDSLEEALNKISSGWMYDEGIDKYVNEKKYEAVTLFEGSAIFLNRTAIHTFGKEFLAMGFELVGEQDVKGMVKTSQSYESPTHTAEIALETFENEPYYLTIVTKK
jgi:hypothetical protein